jgi:hypothetical protein
VEEPAAGAAVNLRDLDAHYAEVEQFPEQVLRELRMLVHFAHERAHLSFGKFTDAVPEDHLVFGQQGQRLHVFSGFLRHNSLLNQGGSEPPMLSSETRPFRAPRRLKRDL